MKVIIIEGPDNCGKDTLIKKLSSHFNDSVKVIHATAPKSSDLFSHYYDGLLHDTLDSYYKKEVSAIIHNRSMYGEYVYGPKYRSEDKSSVAKLISKLEIGQLRTFILSRELYFILLTSDSAELLANNDDGLSISNKTDDIKDEINQFTEVFNLSTIKNKKIVKVNNGDSFRDRDDIYNEVISFIGGSNEHSNISG